MVTVAKVQKELSACVAIQPLAGVLEKLEQATSKTLRTALMSSAFRLAAHGEHKLMMGQPDGWNLLAVARRLRALNHLLVPDVASSFDAALAGLEAIQWREYETATSLAVLMSSGYRNVWDSTGPLIPSRTELEALLFELLRIRGMPVEPGVNLAPLCYLAPAAGIESPPEGSVALAFVEAFDAFAELCGREIPVGAKLSAAPVYACLTIRRDCGHTLPEEPIEHPWFRSPFKDFETAAQVSIPEAFRGVVSELSGRAEQRGFKLSPVPGTSGSRRRSRTATGPTKPRRHRK